jgi:acetolactate decarboxylase
MPDKVGARFRKFSSRFNPFRVRPPGFRATLAGAARQRGDAQRKEAAMATRRSILKICLGLCGCAVCGPTGFGGAGARAEPSPDVRGRGYQLRYVGAQRETIMNGKLAAALDLRALAQTPHLYGIGPIEQLRGEVTIADGRPALARVGPDGKVHVQESFDAGAPFFVWAEVPSWRTVPLPAQVRSYGELEAFVPEAAAAAGLDAQKPLPFLLRGRPGLIEFHVLDRAGDEPHDPQKHKKIQRVFELDGVDAVMVGFHSPGARGVFTPMDSTIHIHFQSADNAVSGHVQKLDIANDVTLAFPSP